MGHLERQCYAEKLEEKINNQLKSKLRRIYETSVLSARVSFQLECQIFTCEYNLKEFFYFVQFSLVKICPRPTS